MLVQAAPVCQVMEGDLIAPGKLEVELEARDCLSLKILGFAVQHANSDMRRTLGNIWCLKLCDRSRNSVEALIVPTRRFSTAGSALRKMKAGPSRWNVGRSRL